MDELLLKFLDKKATQSEEIAVKLWIESDNNNLLYFKHFSDSWSECAASDNRLLFNSLAIIQ